MSTEGISLKHVSALPQREIKASKKPCARHAVFHSFLSDDGNQDASSTTANRKLLIELLNFFY